MNSETAYDERENCIKASLLLIEAELRANRAGQKDEMALLKRVRARVDQRTSEVSTNTGHENGRYVPSRLEYVRR